MFKAFFIVLKEPQKAEDLYTDIADIATERTSSVLGISLIAFLVMSLSDQDGFYAVTFH